MCLRLYMCPLLRRKKGAKKRKSLAARTPAAEPGSGMRTHVVEDTYTVVSTHVAEDTYTVVSTHVVEDTYTAYPLTSGAMQRHEDTCSRGHIYSRMRTYIHSVV
jgi:hypothetical protein